MRASLTSIKKKGNSEFKSIYEQRNDDTPLKGSATQLDNLTLNSNKKGDKDMKFDTYVTPSMNELEKRDMR